MLGYLNSDFALRTLIVPQEEEKKPPVCIPATKSVIYSVQKHKNAVLGQCILSS